jgi:hypothetical protein
MESLSRRLMAAGCLILSGCATTGPLYYWGEYEELVYQMYIQPGKADPANQIAQLREDINKANADGKPVSPGLHAHLGYMYFLQGDTHSAVLEFETEKKLFPESAIFVDSFIGRLKK